MRFTFFSSSIRSLLVFILLGVVATYIAGCSQQTTNIIPSDSEVAQDTNLNLLTLLTSKELYAGQNILVGYVDVELIDDQVVVTYKITEQGWGMTEIHTYIGANPPKKSAPGRFPYKAEGLDCVKEYEVKATLDELGISVGDTIYIAAHAVVAEEEVDLASFITDLQSGITGVAEYKIPVPEDGSFWSVHMSGVNPSPLPLTGIDLASHSPFPSFCTDFFKSADRDEPYDVELYYYNDPFLTSDLNYPVVDKPENLHLLPYLMNHYEDFLDAEIDWWNIQALFWWLFADLGIDIDNPLLALIYSQELGIIPDMDKVKDLEEQVREGSENFEIGCGDLIPVFVNPISLQTTALENNFAQTVIIGVPAPCSKTGKNETAWAKGTYSFPKKGKGRGNWATYFDVFLSNMP